MFPSISGAQIRRLQWPAFFIVCAVFILSHPYTGIRHDGTLYMGDALARLLPGEFHDDLYFLFGSQGRFTLLPALYATLISTFGTGRGTMAGLLVAHIAYIAAAFYLVAAFAPPRWRWLCVVSVTLGWSLYGGDRVFAYSEPFLTARSFAEPVALFGLGLLLRGRVAASLAVLAVSLLIHPLLAIGAFLAAWLFLATTDRRWYLAAIPAIVAVAVLGALQVGPFGDLFAQYDANWLALVQEANPHAFVLQWSVLDYGIVGFDCILLIFAARHLENPIWRRLAFALIVAGVGATLVSLITVDLLHDAFFGKLQIWRAEWVMQWMAIAVLPLVIVRLWADGPQARVAACLLAIAWMAPFSVAPLPLALMALAIDRGRRRVEISRLTVRIVGGATVAIALVIATQNEMRVIKLGGLLDQPIRLIVGQSLSASVLLLAASLAIVVLLSRAGRLALPIAIASLVVSLSLWDQRSAWTHKLESYPLGTNVWPGLIEPTAKVYWYRDLIAPWLLLGHGNFYTQQQGSGAVFSHDMVMELDRRRKLTALLDFQEQICRMMNGLSEKQTACEPDADAVQTLCTDGQIDYVVLQSTLENVKPLASYSTGVVENGYEKNFFLYRCSALNRG